MNQLYFISILAFSRNIITKTTCF